MIRRLAAVLTIASVVLVGAGAAIGAHGLAQERRATQDAELDGIAQSFSREVLARITSAETVVQYLCSTNAGAAGEVLRDRAVRFSSLRGLVLRPWSGRAESDIAKALPAFNLSQRLLLRGGQSLLTIARVDPNRLSLYLAHLVVIRGAEKIGFFEIDPSWLWWSFQELPPGAGIVVVDPAGRRVYSSGGLQSLDLPRFAPKPALSDENPAPIAPVLMRWSDHGNAWRAAIQRVELAGARLPTARWNLVVYERRAGFGLAWNEWGESLLMIPVALLCIGAGTLYLSRRWEPALQRLASGLKGLRAGEFQRLLPDAASDTPGRLIDSYNRTVDVLAQRVGALRTLGEIDRLLLGSSELEASLDAILSKVCELTACDAASLTLPDGDAPGHGRCYISMGPGKECQVSRVGVDEQLALQVARSPGGLKLRVNEEQSWSFLEPMLRRGLLCVQVWPVLVSGEVAALLAVGRRTAEPATTAGGAESELDDHAAECASRLGMVLSNRARDEHLYRQAHFDSLTALPNRLLFRDRLAQELSIASEGSQHGALLYIDLDHFKKVNDTVGHNAGDQLLTVAAQRMRGCLKEGDTVARLGGDEFSVILRNLPDAAAAGDVAQRILEALQKPVHIARRDHQVRASIGITVFPDDGSTLEELLRNADLAMYRAKEGGRARAVFFDSSMTRMGAGLAAESGLFRALRRQEFELYYQPQYELARGSLAGLEALLRWQSRRDGLKVPKDFVGAAESSGLIIEIGEWVIESACRQLAEWRDRGTAPPRLAVNISLQQLCATRFTTLVAQMLERFSLSAPMLELEITEAVLCEEQAQAALRTLAGLGVRLSLDDFGTGVSSLSSLVRYPVQTIKLDQAFVQTLPQDPQAIKLAEALIQMAHALGKQVIAEGVETHAQLEVLRERGCDIVQGFLLGRPATTDEVTQRLSERSEPVGILQLA